MMFANRPGFSVFNFRDTKRWAAAGAKPGALMLKRPTVVFVHGINRDPYFAWQQPGGMAQYLQSQIYIITPFSFADHSGASNDYGSGPLTTDWQTVQNAVEAAIDYFRSGLASYSIYNPDFPSSLGTPALDSTGLAISYSETVAMTLNGFTLAGQLRSAQWDYGLLKELNQSIIGTKDSGDAYVPGS